MSVILEIFIVSNEDLFLLSDVQFDDVIIENNYVT